MDRQDVLQILGKVGAVITDSHIVYTSGKHGSAYVNKDRIYPHTKETSTLCLAIAAEFMDYDVEVVIAPAIGGVALTQWTAFHLSELTGREVLAVYAEHQELSIFKAPEDHVKYAVHEKLEVYLPGHFDKTREVFLDQNEQIVAKRSAFFIGRGYHKDITRKRVLVVEDVLTTGGSAKRVIEEVRLLEGQVVGLGVLCNRGGITAEDVADPPKLFSLVDIELDSWDEAECPLCAQGVPINTEVGKGKDFLARQKKQ